MARRLVAAILIAAGVLAVIVTALLYSLGPKSAFEKTSLHMDYALSKSVRDCTGAEFAVAGMRSPRTLFDWAIENMEAVQYKLQGTSRLYRFLTHAIDKTEQARTAFYARNGAPLADTVTLDFSLPEKEDTTIADVSVALSEGFHKAHAYELSCRSNGLTGGYIVFRKSGPKLHNHNYEEPAVNLLPRACIGHTGQVVVKLEKPADSSLLTAEFKAASFRAVLRNASVTADNHAELEFYLPSMSFDAGAQIAVHAHGLDEKSKAQLQVIRAGRDEKPVVEVKDIELKKQQVTAYSYRDGVDWSVAARFDLPANASSGWYAAVLTQNGKRASFPFVVRPQKGDATPVAVIAATNTWQAYNGWGQGSFYENTIGDNCLATDYGRVISSQRPVSMLDPFEVEPALGEHLFRAERLLARWLDSSGINYVVYSDDDIHENPSILKSHRVVVIPPHSEYYTTEMYDALESHVKRGGSIAYLGGNGIYYKVAKRGTQMEKHENGRIFDLSTEYGGFWYWHHKRSPAALLGVEFDARDFYSFAPYKVLNAAHPLFKGTGLGTGELFGADGSGHEMDVTSESTPKGTIVLAKGTNPKGFGAEMTYYEHPAGGKVFSTGSISFIFALTRDPKVGILLGNVLEAMQ